MGMGDDGANGSDASNSCTTQFMLHDLAAGKPDKLGHRVKDILWAGQNYAIYCTKRGVYVQFSDCSVQEADQRS
jgi:hypothetical protein